jgi:plasmid maintenance system antidote protein VapI
MAFPKSDVRAWMKRTRTNQEQLAKAIGVSAPTVCLVFQGKRHLPMDAAERLANLSGIAVEKLLTDSDATRLLKMLGKRMNSTTRKAVDNANVA